MATGIVSQLALGGLHPSVDGRYVAANGKPFTSVSNAESALNGFPSKLSEWCVGLTVLVKEIGWTEAKEYWVQPKGTTPETYGLVEKGTTDYNDLDNKPTIGNGTNTALPIVGNVKVSASTASGETAGVTVTPGQTTGEIEINFTLPKGADGADGQDGAPGHNPCLGRFNVLPTLSPNPFADARKGDYIYFDTTDQQTSDPVTYVYYFDGTDWDTTGTLVNPNYSIFNTGQVINSVKIKNDLEGGVNDVLSAEQGKTLNVTLSNKVDKIEGKSLINTNFASQVAVDSTTFQKEMVYAILDNNGKLLFGVNKLGDFVFGKGKKTINDIVQEAVDISVSKMPEPYHYGMSLTNGLTVGRNMYSSYEDKTPNEISVNISDYLYCLVDKNNVVIDVINKQGNRL